eukprot:SAG11_NODE_132_length_15459_cov_61.061979_3_plen_185_part_00
MKIAGTAALLCGVQLAAAGESGDGHNGDACAPASLMGAMQSAQLACGPGAMQVPPTCRSDRKLWRRFTHCCQTSLLKLCVLMSQRYLRAHHSGPLVPVLRTASGDHGARIYTDAAASRRMQRWPEPSTTAGRGCGLLALQCSLTRTFYPRDWANSLVFPFVANMTSIPSGICTIDHTVMITVCV